LPLVSTASIVAAARRVGCGVAALNVVQLENIEAVASAAARTGHPVVVQISENAVRYHGALEPVASAALGAARTCSAPVSVHLDHATTAALCAEAVALGLSSVMFDASALEYADNVAATQRVAASCHAADVWVEAELGEVGGKDGVHAAGARTDPDQAAAFVAATGVDGLAVAVGTSHKMVERVAVLDLSLIARLRDSVPVPLVLHGSSGVSDEHLRQAISAGITKVNIATQLNKAFTAAVRARLADHPDEVDPRRYLGAGREAMTDEAARLLTLVTQPSLG
jgi:fructose-bisphosphate aldolase, class II